MSLKLGTTDISGVPTTLINTVNGLASDMVGKADTDLSNVPSSVTNLPPTKLYNFDGQWVHKHLLVFSNVNLGSYSASLSSYLPNDNYSYEVLVSFNAGSGSGSNCYVGTSSSPATNYQNCFFVSTILTQNSTRGTTFGILPVSTRTIYEEITGAKFSTRCEVYLLGYRRTGTNT